MKNVRLGVLVVVLGLLGLRSEAQAASPELRDPFCAKCVDSYGCGMEEALCDAMNCGSIGMATCQEFGTCTGARRLVVCNSTSRNGKRRGGDWNGTENLHRSTETTCSRSSYLSC